MKNERLLKEAARYKKLAGIIKEEGENQLGGIFYGDSVRYDKIPKVLKNLDPPKDMPVVGGFSLVYEKWSNMMGGNGVSGTIRTYPENYWVATIKEDGSIVFDSWERNVSNISKSEVKRLWDAGEIKEK